MNITDDTVAAANRRATGKKTKFPAVVSVRYDRRVARIVIALASGLELAFSPKHAQGLENAHPADLMDAEITPSGLGVHSHAWTQTFTCPRYWKASLAQNAGWLRLGKSAALPRPRQKPPPRAGTVKWVADRRNRRA